MSGSLEKAKARVEARTIVLLLEALAAVGGIEGGCGAAGGVPVVTTASGMPPAAGGVPASRRTCRAREGTRQSFRSVFHFHFSFFIHFSFLQ